MQITQMLLVRAQGDGSPSVAALDTFATGIMTLGKWAVNMASFLEPYDPTGFATTKQ
jgi:hypothetical protein